MTDRDALEEVNELWDAPLVRDKQPSPGRVKAGRKIFTKGLRSRRAFSAARQSTTRRHPKITLADHA